MSDRIITGIDVGTYQVKVVIVRVAKNSKENAFYRAKSYLEGIGLSNVRFLPYKDEEIQASQSKQIVMPFETSRSAVIVDANDIVVGFVGEFKASVIKTFKLPSYCAGFELFLSAFKNTKNDYVPLSRYPSISQDVCLEVADNLPYGDLYSALNDTLVANSPEDCSVDCELIDIFADEKIKGKKRVTFHLIFSSYERTLSESVVSKILSDADAVLATTISAKRV